jgi:hypothetical protein
VHYAISQPKLNPLEQSDREETIQCWLDSNEIAGAWDLAPALVNARVDEADLETVKRTVPAQDLEKGDTLASQRTSPRATCSDPSRTARSASRNWCAR